MTLVIDIGNTTVCIGIYENDVLKVETRLATERQKTDDQFAMMLSNLLSIYHIEQSQIDGGILSSVVPELTHAVQSAVQKLFHVSFLVLGAGIKTGLNILIDNPAQLGADLAAGAVGAIAHYPLPAFIIDLGTATKICAVDENKSFRGCMIAPGVGVSLKALTTQSSLLPHIVLEPPKKACGTNTIESMQSGVVLGTAAMVDGMIDRFAAELGTPNSIILTGGLSSVIAKVCKHETIEDSALLLKGLKVIYDKNQK